ncbi:hypothetical protein N7495_008314 [Penicillium taxi]|uniref:uncharacterized protein n=1 Tax=Penicillium taxi TaxID=168475 RepID=UPI002544E6CD|nr:uncharacterized protein N7495_008314 [Penicillium taxi]KAJ5888273.1 hypothetical protein N7495_008314 [Penicillium taxi]
MSLKRKASFTAIPSNPFAPAPSKWEAVDNTKHLHSRTRKRFRDDRPSDEQIYGNANEAPAKTLRWIFSAQKQQDALEADACNEAMDIEESPFTAETVDPRQQTLLQFFQPRAQPSSPFKPSREALAPRANETAISQEDYLRREAFQQTSSTGSLNSSETTSTTFGQIDTDMEMEIDMDMDTDSSGESSNTAPKMNVPGWI